VATQTNAPGKSITAGAALTEWKLVKADGTLCGLDANYDWIGVTQMTAASGSQVPVRFPEAGTARIICSATIAVGDAVYKAASGCVSTVSTGSVKVGIALSAGASGDSVEVKFTAG
jgi:hypothetical protein